MYEFAAAFLLHSEPGESAIEREPQQLHGVAATDRDIRSTA